MTHVRWSAVICAVLVSACTPGLPPSPTPTFSPIPTAPATPATPTELPNAISTASPTPTVQPSATAAPTPTVQPTPTEQPSGCPTPAPVTPPPCGSTGLAIDPTAVARHLDALQEIADRNGGIRAAGTPGYDASADYVFEQLRRLGYDVTRQPVEFTFFDEEAPVTLQIGDDASWTGAEWLHAMLYSGEGAVSAVADLVGTDQTLGCEQPDWSSFVAGHIAVVPGGGCRVRDKVVLAQNSGAAALISTTFALPNQVLQPTLLDPNGIDIPVVLAGGDPSAALFAAATDGTKIDLDVDVETRKTTIDNVIGEIAGTSDDVFMLGAHLDSVLDGPGINDNGSGVATLLALAEALSERGKPQLTVRFGFWAAEEFGEFGSAAYARSLSEPERGRVSAYVNLDMVGSPNPARYVYDTPDDAPDSTSQRLTELLLAAFDELGAPAFTADLSGGSDHAQFAAVGIPTGGVFSGLAPLTVPEAEAFGGQPNVPADACYHLACDDRTNVNVESALLFGSAVAIVVEELAYTAS